MRKMSTKSLTYCALLAALSVVLARLVVPMPNAFTRFSIEAVPIFLAGLFFGPVAGGMVGFTADLVGCLFSGFGYNPIFCIPPILYGVCAGLFRPLVYRRGMLLWLIVSFLTAMVLGSVLYQSVALAYVYNTAGTFRKSLIYFLSTRSVQFALTGVVDILILYFLLKRFGRKEML